MRNERKNKEIACLFRLQFAKTIRVHDMVAPIVFAGDDVMAVETHMMIVIAGARRLPIRSNETGANVAIRDLAIFLAERFRRRAATVGDVFEFFIGEHAFACVELMVEFIRGRVAQCDSFSLAIRESSSTELAFCACSSSFLSIRTLLLFFKYKGNNL